MAIQLHRSDRADLLVSGLAELLGTPLADPFWHEVVAVPAKGTERWLAQQLSHRLGASAGREDGVCAGVRFVAPPSLVAMVLGLERDDPWQPDHLVWPLLACIDESIAEPWAATLARHLGQQHVGIDAQLRRDRRYFVARGLARLFASYAAQRPALLTAWRSGQDTDGAGRDLDRDLRWQPLLFRKLLALVPGPPPDVRLAETVTRLHEDDETLELPGRLSLFGHTRLPAAELAVIKALGAHRDVHLWLPQAAPELWDALAPVVAEGPIRRRSDPTTARHPLLAALGRDARELQRSLSTLGATEQVLRDPAPATPSTLLGWLQSDLRADRPAAEQERQQRVVSTADRSIQVHACHGPARQVEVLREVLVGLLADDPTLEPRDILIQCPDVETYAPLISANFGLPDQAETGAHPAHRLRVQLADRALSSTNPLLALAQRLVGFVGGRATASEVLDLLSSETVRHRFGLDDDALARLAQWIQEAGIRWGLDAAARAPFGMGRFPHNTWKAGLDRVIIGITMAGEDYQHIGQVLPLDDVPSNDIELAGRLAEFVDRLHAAQFALTRASTVSEWGEALRTSVLSLGGVGRDDAWQVAQFEKQLSRLQAAAQAATSTDGEVTLSVADARSLLASHLGGRPSRTSFRTGALTVCTMVPMRSVPHRVVCLLGLDDDVFPRAEGVDGDDVLARAPLTGERDLRSEDRQLLLDALLAARDHLVLCYSGADEHTGQVKPPAVPLGDVLDAARATASGPGLDHLLVQHPLQAHHPSNLTAGGLVPERVFSFDTAALSGAQAAAQPPQPPPPLLAAPLAPPTATPPDLALDDLLDFFGHPARSFLRGRMQLSTPRAATEITDAIPIRLGPLEKWAIGDRLLAALLAGAEPSAVFLAEQLRGSLPPGALGVVALRQIVNDVGLLFNQTAALRSAEARSIEIDIDLGEGRRLGGSVDNVFGTRLVALSFSRLKPRLRLLSWVQLLALATAHPDQPWTAHSVGRDPREGPQVATLRTPGPSAAAWLSELVSWYDLGQRQPLAAPVATAEAWFQGERRRTKSPSYDPARLAAPKWTTDDFKDNGIPGEDDDPWHCLAWGRRAPLQSLLDADLAPVAAAIWAPALGGGEGGFPMSPAASPSGSLSGPPASPDPSAAASKPFDITAALPTGTTLLEASAGTGKTWTIGALVARYVAEGHARLEELLVVTFSRAASRELRQRVRDHLVELEQAFTTGVASDAVATLLLTGDPETVAARQARVRAALNDFDAATIATTHQFCHLVLHSLGVAGDSDPQATLVTDLNQLTTEVVDDLFLRAFADEEEPAFDYATASILARRVTEDSQAALAPTQGDVPPLAARRVAFAQAVRTEVERRKRQLRLLSYDDLLGHLATALRASDSAARDRMRQRWKIVLVDEFQDTDPVQWEVLDRAFSGHATMVLIGDPKQAIYAFRGGDIFTYLKAAASATHTYTLPVNYRSDGPLVESLNQFLGQAALGEAEIVVRPITAHHEQRLTGAPSSQPVRLRVLRRVELGLQGGELARVQVTREHIMADLAGDIAALLASNAEFNDPDDGPRPLRAGDVAVLAASHRELLLAQHALAEMGVRSVIASAGSVFATPAATEWLTLLEALEQPHRMPRVRSAALTPFLGYPLAELAAGGDELTDRLAEQLRDWASLLTTRGVAAVLAAALSSGLTARVLAVEGGERRLTDLRQLAEIMHEVTLSERLGPVALTAWLRRHIAEGRSATERIRRLDTDESAVQLATIHASKGMQYPIVYLPGLADYYPQPPDVPLYHDSEGNRCLDVGGSQQPTWKQHLAKAKEEDAGERLRLCYVAITRAQCQVVLWWAPSYNTEQSSLNRLLLGRQPGQVQVPDRADVLSDERLVSHLRLWQEAGALTPERSVVTSPLEAPGAAEAGDLDVREFDRAIDLGWARRSYSSLTHHDVPPPLVGSEPEEVLRKDETDSTLGDAPASGVPAQEGEGGDPAAAQVASPMASLPKGASFGSLVHGILEHSDPAAPQHAGDFRAELFQRLREQLTYYPVDLDADVLVEALYAVCHTPMGSLVNDVSLIGVPRSDRLCELDFELPLAGGDRPRADVLLGDLAPILRKHLPAGDPVRAYADALDQPLLGEQPLRGYLTGSIDLVMRVDGRYFVADYKTNWLGSTAPDDALSLHDYRPESLAAAMSGSSYPLQALLYALVLHRYLRWRLVGYDCEQHFGGVLYLYLRGMAGPETPRYDAEPTGVFSWRPPSALVTEISDLLDGVVHG